MENCLLRLSFANRYLGIVRSVDRPEPAVYQRMSEDHTSLSVWYFQSDDEVLWLAMAGEHIEPLAAWFRSAHTELVCSSALAAGIQNGGKVRCSVSEAIIFKKSSINEDAFAHILLANFALYLPHADTFLVLRDALSPPLAMPIEPDEWIRGLKAQLPFPVDEASDSDFGGDGEDHRHYDPIDSQLKEVMRSIGGSTCQAAADLAREWKQVFKEDPPADVQNFESEITETIKRIAELVSVGDRGEVLEVVDDYAMALRANLRAAFDLRSRLHDFEWPPSPPTLTFERAATPIILRAIKRYARDVAGKLDLEEYEFLPVVGQDFEVRPRLFSVPHPTHTQILPTVLVEFPAEIRLRFGAIPVIAREIAQMKGHEIDTIAAKFHEELAFGFHREWHTPELRLAERGSADDARDRYLETDLRALAADLLAVAAVGPQYVFAVARFAVGTLGDFSTAAWHSTNRLSFRFRISACLGLLNSLGDYPPFVSPYLPEGPKALPDSIVSAVRRAVGDIKPHEPNEIVRITKALAAGSIVSDASPSAILSALWDAVARGSGYLNEVAALISLAGIT